MKFAELFLPVFNKMKALKEISFERFKKKKSLINIAFYTEICNFQIYFCLNAYLKKKENKVRFQSCCG